MKTYIALLRGINVSGQKKIKMASLKSHFENLGFNNVRTYIQSGNIIFESKKNTNLNFAKIIKEEILAQYGFDVPTLVLTSDYIKNILYNNPWVKKRNISTTEMYFTFLKDKPSIENILKVRSENYLPDQFKIDERIIYIYTPNGYGKTKLNNNFFERKLKVQATTRNWKTLTKILEIINLV